MSMFSQTFETLKRFKSVSSAQLTNYAHAKGHSFSASSLRTMQRGTKRTVNTDVLLGVGLFFAVSPSFLLEGKPHNSDLYGFSEEGRGVTAFLVAPVLMSLVDYLAEYEPSMNGEKKNWKETKERGYSATLTSLDDSLRGERHDYPTFPVRFDGVVVGLALNEDKACWLEERLVKAASHNS